jgi:O-antigen/teichoic acid export membrane protein
MASRPGQRPVLLWAAESGRLVLGFAVLAVLARLAGAETLGAYLSVVSLATLVPRLLDLGLPLAIGYFLRLKPDGLRACSRLLSRHAVLAMPAAMLLAASLVWFPFEGAAASALARSHWPQIGVLIVAELAMLLGLAAFIPTTRFKAYFGTTLLPPTLMLLGLGALRVSRPTQPPDAGELLDLLTAATSIGCVFMIVAVLRACREADGHAFDGRAVYRYGLRTYSSAVAKILAQRFDRLYLATVLGSAGYAQYSLAISIRDMVTFPANMFALTLRNRQIDLIGHDHDIPGARRLLARVSAIWALAGLGVAAALLPAWATVVRIGFGVQLQNASHFVSILVFSCAPMAVMSFAWNHLYALNRPGRVTILTTTSLLLALPTYALFIKFAGPSDGVAFATVAWSAASAAASLAWALVSASPTLPPRTTP